MSQPTRTSTAIKAPAPHPIALAASLLILTVGATITSHAQEAAPAAAEPASSTSQSPSQASLPAVRIQAARNKETATSPVTGYIAQRSATASKTDTALADTAQSVSVITRDMVIDQGATNLQDALNYAAGVRANAYGLDSRSDAGRIRGGFPDEYLDGLRKNFEYYTSNTRTEPFTLERIEVLRGPSAMLYGQGSTGGVLNMVSKRPQAEAKNEIGLAYGSWHRKQLEADFTGPLSADGQWLYRFIAMAREADTQVDHVSDDRRVIAPSLTWQPSAATSLTLTALAQKDHTGSTSQFFPWAGTVTSNPNGRLPTSRFIGEPEWDRYDTERKSLGWALEHRVSDQLTLRQNVRWTKTDNIYRTHYGDAFNAPGDWQGDLGNKRLLGRFADNNATITKLITADQNLQGKLRTGDVRHDWLAGMDLAHYRKTGLAGSGSPAYPGFIGTEPLIDAYAPVYANFTPPAQSPIDPFTMKQAGFYLQDQMRLGGNWLVTAGLRHDKARNETRDLVTDLVTVEKTSATTKRGGLMYQLDNGWSPYVSYSESFTPQANRTASDGIGNATFSFKPLRGKQWELGTKFESADGRTHFNVAAFDLRESNHVIDSSVPSPTRYSQAGETRAVGLEADIRTTVARTIDLIANYTYTDLDDNGQAGAIENVPAHQASVWGKWRFAIDGKEGFSLGAGARHFSAYHDGAGPTVPVVTLLDATLAWEDKHWRTALNVTNLTDKVYVAACLNRGDCWWGARRAVNLSVAYRW